MHTSDVERFAKAKNYCFLLLKFRPRSEKEFYSRLKRKKFEEPLIRQTLGFLKEKGFIDDNYFARSWIDSRLKKPLGLRRIRQELRQKGVDKQTIESNIEKIKNSYSEESVVSQLARRRLDKSKGIDPGKLKVRIYAYLLRRGFSPETVINALNQLL